MKTKLVGINNKPFKFVIQWDGENEPEVEIFNGKFENFLTTEGDRVPDYIVMQACVDFCQEWVYKFKEKEEK